MKLYTLKSEKGYIKYVSHDELLTVEISKASVYDESQLPFMEGLLQRLKEKGHVNPRIAQLILEEKDFHKVVS